MDRFQHTSLYARNGLNLALFKTLSRNFTGKIRILIEGDPASEYKNVDESFQITNQLDPRRYEVWFMSYNVAPKSWYRVDKFLHKIPHIEVANIYQQCHILLKTSIFESFYYPPLEMMATGGFVVAILNRGNAEYLRDNENCLLYPQGDLNAAITAIERICSDSYLREKLYEGGLKTTQARDWQKLRLEIVKLYTSN